MNTLSSSALMVIDPNQMESKLNSVLCTLEMAQVEKDDRDFLIKEAINQLNDIKNTF